FAASVDAGVPPLKETDQPPTEDAPQRPVVGREQTAPTQPVRPPPAETGEGQTPPRSGTPKPPTWLPPGDKAPAPGSTEKPIFESAPKTVDDVPMVEPEHPPRNEDEEIAE